MENSSSLNNETKPVRTAKIIDKSYEKTSEGLKISATMTDIMLWCIS